jgi:hypothetical protein
VTAASLSLPNIPAALSNPGLPTMDSAVFDFDDLNAMCAEYEERISVAQEARDRAERELASFRARVEREVRDAKVAAQKELDDTKKKMQAELDARIKKTITEHKGPRERAESELAAAQERLLEMTEEIRNLRGVIAKLAAHPSMTEIPVVQEQAAAPAPRPTQAKSGVARMMREPKTWAPAEKPAPAKAQPQKRTPPPPPQEDDGKKSKRRVMRARRR